LNQDHGLSRFVVGLGLLCLLLVCIFPTGYASEGFSLRGPTHCFSLGRGYDCRFVFSINSLGYEGRVDLEVEAPNGITADLETPIFLEGSTNCMIIVYASLEAPLGNQTVVIKASGGQYADSISVCMLVSDLTMLTMKTSPLGVPVDILFDNTRYHLGAEPLTLQVRVGKHTIEPLSNSSNIGPTRYVRGGVNLSYQMGNSTLYEDWVGPINFNVVNKSVVTILFREEKPSVTEKSRLKESVLVLAVIVLAILVFAGAFWRRRRDMFRTTLTSGQAVEAKRSV